MAYLSGPGNLPEHRAQRAPVSAQLSMTQGVAYSRQGTAGDPSFNAAGFKDDVRAFFGSGTGLQELYIQPARLSPEDWHVLAEAAKWSRANARRPRGYALAWRRPFQARCVRLRFLETAQRDRYAPKPRRPAPGVPNGPGSGF